MDLAGHAFDADAGERLSFGAVRILLKASSAAVSIWEELPPVQDTPLHIHEHEDEAFHVLEGDHVFRCGDTEYELGPGGMVFLPRGVPHAHRRVVAGEGRLLVLAAPGGFVGFFRMLAAAERAGTIGPDAYAAASARYGITWLD